MYLTKDATSLRSPKLTFDQVADFFERVHGRHARGMATFYRNVPVARLTLLNKKAPHVWVERVSAGTPS